MKLLPSACLIASLPPLLSGAGAQAQGTFHNFAFESANLPTIPASRYSGH